MYVSCVYFGTWPFSQRGTPECDSRIRSMLRCVEVGVEWSIIMPEEKPNGDVEAVIAEPKVTTTDPFVGTWKLNVARSKFGGSMKPPKELTIIIQEQGNEGFEGSRS
jgi:hypothetical protein